jgi:hypothetical protein
MTQTDTPISPSAALASEASRQRGHSRMRAHSASKDARERADDTRPEPGSSARVALASEASGQRGNSFEVRAHSASEDARERADDTRPEPGSSARVALASEASGQRGNSFEVRAPDTRPEPGSSARGEQSAAAPKPSVVAQSAADAPARRRMPSRSPGYRGSNEESVIMRKRNA